jgi:hypothetical protein
MNDYVPKRKVLRWDPCIEPEEGDMEFRLTYAGRLLATQGEQYVPQRSLHIHGIRKEFHKQLKQFWQMHPNLATGHSTSPVIGSTMMKELFHREGFAFKPIVTERNGLICKLEILILRAGPPGKTLYDIDNRLKTIFDALRMPKSPSELGSETKAGISTPGLDESPFYVLLEDDNLITHIAVTSDMLLEPIDGIPEDESVRLVIDVAARPYHVTMDNLDFS